MPNGAMAWLGCGESIKWLFFPLKIYIYAPEDYDWDKMAARRFW